MPRSRSTAIQSERTRRRSPRVDFAGQLDRPAKQQQFLGQSGVAGVGMRNHRNRAPAAGLVGQGAHQSALAVTEERGAVAGKRSRYTSIVGGYMAIGLFAKHYGPAGDWS
jgi:hypothetical protein